MRTPQETLRLRRAAELPDGRASDSTIAPVRALQINSWNGEPWIFPWSHFSAACRQGADESEQPVLTFVNHEVPLEGARLALLLPEIARFHLDNLRDMPADVRSPADQSEPFIGRVAVRSASDSSKGGA